MRQRLIMDIGRVEFLLTRSPEDPAELADRLGRLRASLQAIDSTLSQRRQQAGQPIVDLGRWRNAGGVSAGPALANASAAPNAGDEPPTA